MLPFLVKHAFSSVHESAAGIWLLKKNGGQFHYRYCTALFIHHTTSLNAITDLLLHSGTTHKEELEYLILQNLTRPD